MKILDIYPFSSKVLAVAVEGTVGDWAAYIGAVEGKNREKEALQVAHDGEKIVYSVAKVIFPEIAKKLEWRR